MLTLTKKSKITVRVTEQVDDNIQVPVLDKRSAQIERALASISDANIDNSSSDEASLKQFDLEYFARDSVHSDDDDSDTDSEGIETKKMSRAWSRKVEDEGDFSNQDDSEEEDDDDPIVTSDKLDRVLHLLEDTIAEDPNIELQRAHEFNCGCVTFDGQPCIRQFSDEEIFDFRISMQGLNEGRNFVD